MFKIGDILAKILEDQIKHEPSTLQDVYSIYFKSELARQLSQIQSIYRLEKTIFFEEKTVLSGEETGLFGGNSFPFGENSFPFGENSFLTGDNCFLSKENNCL